MALAHEYNDLNLIGDPKVFLLGLYATTCKFRTKTTSTVTCPSPIPQHAICLSINTPCAGAALEEFCQILIHRNALATDSEGTSLLMHIIWVMEEWHCTRYLVRINPGGLHPIASVCDQLLQHGADVEEGMNKFTRTLPSPLVELKPNWCIFFYATRPCAMLQLEGESAAKYLLEAPTAYKVYMMALRSATFTRIWTDPNEFLYAEPCHWTLLKRRIISCPICNIIYCNTNEEFVRSYANTVGILVMNTVKMVTFYKL